MNKALQALGALVCAFAAGAVQAQITLEAEAMTRTNYTVDGPLIRLTSNTGTASTSFTGPAAAYSMKVEVELEADGQSTLEVYKGSTLLRKYTYPTASNGTAASFTIAEVGLLPGDVIKLVGRKHKEAYARVDKVVLTPVAVIPAPVTIEAETMSRVNYTVDNTLIKVTTPYTSGTATKSFTGVTGTYDLKVQVELESDGQSRLEVFKGATQVGTYTYPIAPNSTVATYTVPGVSLTYGDTLKIVGYTNAGALARVDKLVLTPAAAPAPQPEPTPTPTPNPTAGLYPVQGATGGLPVIPGATGFGINTRAGRGGTVYRVTNLNASGEGSLKACVDATVPRVCVFETSGTIHMTSNLTIRNPYITIAGQTAPSPGITIRGAGLAIETNDVLLQHLRIRTGDDPVGPGSDRDTLAILANSRDAYNIVLDHVSASWSTDELFATWANPSTIYKIYDVTVRNSVFTEALSYSIHSEGEHSAGMLVGTGTSRVALVNNVLGFNGWRNPFIGNDATDIMVVNNLLYRTRGTAWTDQIDFGSKGPLDTPMRTSVVGNNYLLAPGATAQNTISIRNTSATSFKMYQVNNLGPRYSATNPWAVVTTDRSLSSIEALTPPVWATGLVAMDAANVETYTLGSSGARPMDRDPVDARVLGNISLRQGGIINSPSQVGGWPALAVVQRPLTLPENPNVTTASGYTNLELWLHAMAREVEGS
jgi:hypothetical protein